jgi:hypothetical protein
MPDGSTFMHPATNILDEVLGETAVEVRGKLQRVIGGL